MTLPRGQAARCAAPDFIEHELLAIVNGRVDAAGALGETDADALDACAWRATRGCRRQSHESKLA
ncbi:hypothetical protein [Burkholderia sp. AU38729]|uniref:hypothetical protein n=1 Tax=Burkholderia sp. AU38729 TaxID=2879633 RepID=UPI001CF3B0F2|nr:hypothetical protein [Burkholderia sp. AU38729]MCA8061170.1 hypothetical protein [Burkholderia sp. AU38729]